MTLLLMEKFVDSAFDHLQCAGLFLKRVVEWMLATVLISRNQPVQILCNSNILVLCSRPSYHHALMCP